MPCAYHMNLEDGLVTISGEANTTVSEFQEVGEQLLADPSFDPYLPQIIDLRDVELSRDPASAESLRHFTVSSYRPKVQASIAIVINESLDNHSVADLYYMSCMMDKTELFDHYDQALKWLMRHEFAASGQA